MFGKRNEPKRGKSEAVALGGAHKPPPSPAESLPHVPPAVPLEERKPLPTFYREPHPLSSTLHRKLRLQAGDASFSSGTISVPIVVSEFAEAARTFPIVFLASNAAPVGLLGLGERNVFVDAGKWAEGAYVPAYVRRYPFVSIAAADGDAVALGIDLGSERLSEAPGGQDLFTETGEPTALTRQAMSFCQAFHSDHLASDAFSAALRKHDLLIDHRADVTLPDGRITALQGFQIVDPGRFAMLDESTVVDWHRRGWLALVHFHLASLGGFRDLLMRQSAREATPLAH